MAAKRKRRLLKSGEVCAILSVSPLTLVNYRKEGTGPPFVIIHAGEKDTIRYPSDSMMDWIAANLKSRDTSLKDIETRLEVRAAKRVVDMETRLEINLECRRDSRVNDLEKRLAVLEARL